MDIVQYIATFDIAEMLRAVGYVGLAAIVFSESGLLIGFFLPGDSLLFTAGFLASQDYFSIAAIMAVSFIAAVLGDSFGYAFGKKVGPRIFNREDSFLFHREHLTRARVFYETYGKKTIIIARFMPVVRTFAPILAGVGEMHYKTFFSYNIIGGFLWAIGLTGLGYFLGSAIPDIDRYLLPIIGAIIFFSILPGIIHVLKDPQHRRRIMGMFIKRRDESHT